VRAIVTPWFEQGNVLDYVSQNLDADRLALVLVYFAIFFLSAKHVRQVKGLARSVQHAHSKGNQVENLHPVSSFYSGLSSY
jgi:hypothetical protein